MLYIYILFINMILAAIDNAILYVLLIGAIYRYYERCRRIHNDSQPERLHAVNLMLEKLLYASRYIHIDTSGQRESQCINMILH